MSVKADALTLRASVEKSCVNVIPTCSSYEAPDETGAEGRGLLPSPGLVNAVPDTFAMFNVGREAMTKLRMRATRRWIFAGLKD